MFLPNKIFFTKGVGNHRAELHSFELALRDAGIEKCNLVQVSSIMPPGCRVISRAGGLRLLKPGAITYCVMSRCSSNEPRRLLAASVGCAVPSDKTTYGYISEHHAFGQTEKQAGDYAEDLAAAMLASTLGIDFNVDHAWNVPSPGNPVAILWLRRPPTDRRSDQGIGSQEPIRIGPPDSLRPLTSSLRLNREPILRPQRRPNRTD
jgi:arginine decarboxylase